MNRREGSGFGSPVWVFVSLLVSSSLFAGFASTEVFLPAVGRIQGAGTPPSQFYATVWATNLTGSQETVTFEFLKQGQANTTPVKFTDVLAAGQTKVYENIVENNFHLTNALGAARVTSTGEVFLAERIYNQLPGDDIGNTEGLFFAGVPKAFSISLGQTASIQGVDQGGSENFRYNFALIETGGGSPTVHVALLDDKGSTLGAKDYLLQPYEQIQPNVTDLLSTVSTTNARIAATVTSGTGSILLAGAQVANESQDPSGFEMSFRNDLLGGGAGTAGVTSLNGLTGALTLTAGSGISVTPSGSQISIAYSGGGDSGLTSVTHDASLAGAGTGASPLAIANGQVVRSLNGLHDSVTLAAGSNVTITPSGSMLTIASSGGGAGLTLPFNGSVSSGASAFQVSNTGTGDALHGEAGDANHAGVAGINSGPGQGLYGQSASGDGVQGISSSGYGVRASSDLNWAIYGFSAIFTGVVGETNATSDGHYGVLSLGNFAATGMKQFIEPHPADPSKEIRYVCLEGRESGTYFRGTGRLSGGFATIEVPDDFRIVTSDDGLTIQLTPVGGPADLWVLHEGLDRITVQGSSDVEFHFMVNGIRKAFNEFQPVAENREFIPRSASDSRFALSLPAESIRRLKANGTLNPDGSINLDTAHRLGWDRQESWKRAEAARK